MSIYLCVYVCVCVCVCVCVIICLLTKICCLLSNIGLLLEILADTAVADVEFGGNRLGALVWVGFFVVEDADLVSDGDLLGGGTALDPERGEF